MKTSMIHLLLVVVLVMQNACTGNFEEINKNPNAGEETNGIYYLTSVIVRTAYDYQRDAYMGKPASAGRYITMLRNAGNDAFGWGPEGWDGHYYRLSDNMKIYELAEKSGEEHYMALSRILEVFNFAYITELWGDIPYSEALRSLSDRIIYPKYDKQEDIYPDLIRKLREANTALQNSAGEINANADVLYHGDKLKWRKFANSLRLRMLLRASEKIPDAFGEIAEIANNPSQHPVFTSNQDNAELPYQENVTKDMWPGSPMADGGSLANEYHEFIKRRPSKEIIDFFLDRDDPRLPVLFDPVPNPENGTVDNRPYVGVPIALRAVYEYNGGGDNISTLRKELFYTNAHELVKASLITYPEVCFILSEATQQGRIVVSGETARSLYEKGITASLNYWGITDRQLIETYLAHEKVAYNGTQAQVVGQKWAALFIKGCEGWFDYRRTNDVLGLNDGLVTDGLAQDFIPYRYIYPDSERAQNREQYERAIAIFGEDNINTKMWLIK
jgi:hypothetical protein